LKGVPAADVSHDGARAPGRRRRGEDRVEGPGQRFDPKTMPGPPPKGRSSARSPPSGRREVVKLDPYEPALVRPADDREPDGRSEQVRERA